MSDVGEGLMLMGDLSFFFLALLNILFSTHFISEILSCENDVPEPSAVVQIPVLQADDDTMRLEKILKDDEEEGL